MKTLKKSDEIRINIMNLKKVNLICFFCANFVDIKTVLQIIHIVPLSFEINISSILLIFGSEINQLFVYF